MGNFEGKKHTLSIKKILEEFEEEQKKLKSENVSIENSEQKDLDFLSDEEKKEIAEKYKVGDLEKITKKNGQILISGYTPEQWEKLWEGNDNNDIYRNNKKAS